MGRITKFVAAAFFCLSICVVPTDVHAGSESHSKESKQQALIKMEPKIDRGTASQKPSTISPPARSSAELKLSGGVEEENLALQWDDWHNTFANAVASGMVEDFAPMLRLRRGLKCWYRYEVTSDKRIKKVEITKSSGNIWFDQLVRRSVQKLEGNDVLAFPAGSLRSEVSSELAIKLGGGEKGGYLRLGDVEYRKFEPGYRVPDSKSTKPDSQQTGR